MKILALTYLYPNSVTPNHGIFVHNRLRAIHKHHDVKVINPIPWFPKNGRLSRYRNFHEIPFKENLDGIEVYHPRFFVVPRFFKFLDAITYKTAVMPLVRKLYNTFPFDLVDLHWTYPDLPTGCLIKHTYNKKMLVTLRGKEAFYINEGVGRSLLIKKNIVKADAVISLSRELQDLAINMGVEEKKCYIIRNGVDTSAFYYLNGEDCRKHLGISLSEKVVISVGSLNYRKGFDRIIKHFPTLLRKVPGCKLYIIGAEGPDGDYRQGIYSLVDELGLRGKVHFPGSVDNRDLIYWYNAADVFCLASRGEGSPNVLAEALACGCPSVATNVGSVEEILKDKSHGIIVPNNSRGILGGLQAALNRDWDRKMIFNDMKEFDWDWCADQVISVYKNV